ncbi:hypothetical protein FHG87_013381 [Trinorchestia longiramus]|nr:hypothetical protein FHG87_013381 [Trinorchestia longiramus]
MNHLSPMVSVAEANISSAQGQSTAGASGGGQSPQPPSLLGSPVHSAPSLPANSITLPATPHFHKKSRKKRKELDALVPEEKIRRKSSFGSAGASCSFNGDSDDTEGGRLGLLPKSSSMSGSSSGFWSFVPGVLAIVLVVGTAVMAMAALRLLMVTRRDMETLTRRLGSVLVSSSACLQYLSPPVLVSSTCLLPVLASSACLLQCLSPSTLAPPQHIDVSTQLPNAGIKTSARLQGVIIGLFDSVEVPCVAVCCRVLPCAAVCCRVLPCAAVCCRVLPCAAVCCRVLPCVAVCCCVLSCEHWDTAHCTNRRNISTHCKNTVHTAVCTGIPAVYTDVPAVYTDVPAVSTEFLQGIQTFLHCPTKSTSSSFSSSSPPVEARSSELPARFHEAHVRLQELQRNTSALWEVVHTFRDSLETCKNKVEQLKTEVSSLQSSVQASPLLTSLPQDVQALQSSVASFGSTLQDLQTAVKSLRTLQQSTGADLSDMKSSMHKLENSTTLPPDKDGTVVPVGVAVAELRLHQQQHDVLEATARHNISAWKEELHDSISNLKVQLPLTLTSLSLLGTAPSYPHFPLSQVQQLSTDAILRNISQELEQHTRPTLNNGVLNNLTADVRNMSGQLQQLLGVSDAVAALAQNVSVVKGVEKKLEGSQLQLASSVSSLKQQLLALQHTVSALTPAPTTTSAPDSLSAPPAQGQRSRRRKSVSVADEEPYVSADENHLVRVREIRRAQLADAADATDGTDLKISIRPVVTDQLSIPAGLEGDEQDIHHDIRNFDGESTSDFSNYSHPSNKGQDEPMSAFANDPGMTRYSSTKDASSLGNVIPVSDVSSTMTEAMERRSVSVSPVKAGELAREKSGLHFVHQTADEGKRKILLDQY